MDYRLNLGAGNKPLTGYINVDLEVHDDGHEWIQWDFHDGPLPPQFGPGSCQTILASHLVEHLHPKVVQRTLAGWREALRPGGVLILEQPDLLRCCVNLLQAMTSNDPALVTQMGLWGVYGHSMTHDDGMGHQWGYWPASLEALLRKAGFTDIRETRPQVKPWGAGVRDFRLEATK